MKEKKFRLSKAEIKELIKPIGACYATDQITVDGSLVGYMYREVPDFAEDSGWRFFSGTEDQEYVDNPNNTMIYEVNTIANYDPAIIPYLYLEIGTELEREGDSFKVVSS
jgi:hypothetical protein